MELTVHRFSLRNSCIIDALWENFIRRESPVKPGTAKFTKVKSVTPALRFFLFQFSGVRHLIKELCNIILFV